MLIINYLVDTEASILLLLAMCSIDSKLNFFRCSWQVDRAGNPKKIKLEAEKREDVVCISALNGDGLDEFCNAVQEKLKVLERITEICHLSQNC